MMRSLTSLIWKFHDDDRGVVNIDWVALTSAILLLAIAVVYSIYGTGVDPVVEQMTSVMDDVANDL